MHRFALVCFVACGCRAYSDASLAPDVAGDGVVGGAGPAAPASSGSFPLKLWMAANLARPMKAQDLEALNRSLSLVATNAPPELAGWTTIAELGARAAAEGDIERVRQSCSDCHERYREEYRERFRSRGFPFHDTQQRSAP